MAKKVWQAGSEIRAVNETDRQGGKPGFTFDEAVDSEQTNRRLL